jgi:hypothetical protein
VIPATRKLLLAGLIFSKADLTSQITIRVMDGNSTFEVVPSVIYGSLVSPPPIWFPEPQLLAGLKGTTLTNTTMIAVLSSPC